MSPPPRVKAGQAVELSDCPAVPCLSGAVFSDAKNLFGDGGTAAGEKSWDSPRIGLPHEAGKRFGWPSRAAHMEFSRGLSSRTPDMHAFYLPGDAFLRDEDIPKTDTPSEGIAHADTGDRPSTFSSSPCGSTRPHPRDLWIDLHTFPRRLNLPVHTPFRPRKTSQISILPTARQVQRNTRPEASQRFDLPSSATSEAERPFDPGSDREEPVGTPQARPGAEPGPRSSEYADQDRRRTPFSTP
ncbi:hypothetical protein HNR07_001706 [Nocardiopsis metallicus]|uniref:Uncharacterized protein n=1 Tax=Nocardiopsis metallicus TaxID=179819 RepID=A0A840W1C2_9ACTN|nr:hypothetical protein [Nocardiopsis metallicus]